MRTTIGSWALLLLFSACGGSVDVPQSSGAGASSTSSSSSGASSSGMGGMGGTTSSASSSSSSSSSSSGAGGGVPDCNTLGYVAAGLGCGLEGTSCRMDEACCQGSLTCKAGVWTADPVACAQPCLDCGAGLACAGGAICVHDTSGGDGYQCVKNPCPGVPSCACASSACAMNFQQCKSTQMYTVTCGN